ncbi:MAG: endonuclease/exonuclease/phosphatase family protein [Candidatus Cloacimonetes bacterium]|nr:endonuclease/exonuclease/phosphatase family protein [Candidatus Cloacimonadota bacterium]
MKIRAIILISIISLTFNGCDIFNTTFNDLENARLYEANTFTEAPVPASLKIMTWNIKFGGARIDFFFDGWGDEVLMTEDVVIENTQNIADYLNEVDPDIVLLQELDIDSKRSAYVDQLQYLLNATALNYGAYASQWKADFIPSDGLGRMNSGNAILSKWEITDAIRIALPLIDQDGLTQYFYLRRNILKTKIQIGTEQLQVLNIHAAAYSKDGTKKEQIDIYKGILDGLNSEGLLFVAGGDFNAIPPNAVNIIGLDFPDRPEGLSEDFEVEDYDTNDLVEFYADYHPDLPAEDYILFEEEGDYFSPYYTHSIYINLPQENNYDPELSDIDWNRKLDYLFTNNETGFIANSDSTHQDTRQLSDHCPVTVELEW